MRLVLVITAILAISFAESDQKYDDLVAMETMELKKQSSDLTPEASVYSYVPQNQGSSPWQNLPSPTWTPPKAEPIQPIHTHVPIPANDPYVPTAPVSPPYVPPVVSKPTPPVQSDYVPPQNDYYYPQNTWRPPHHHVPTTTTPIPVIKNEQQFWDNGAYRYEYQIADGTWVGEEGYYTDPKNTDESLVKRGWYSYVGADGKTYTVKYWADWSGFHAYGDHLPTPPPAHASHDKIPVTQKPIYYPSPPVHYPPKYPQQGYGK